MHKYLWFDCSYHGLNPGRIHSLCPQRFLFNKIDMEISFVCFKAVQNIAFHKFSPSRSAWDAGLDVKGSIEELSSQERRDWRGKSFLMCNPQRIWVITAPAGALQIKCTWCWRMLDQSPLIGPRWQLSRALRSRGQGVPGVGITGEPRRNEWKEQKIIFG